MEYTKSSGGKVVPKSRLAPPKVIVAKGFLGSPKKVVNSKSAPTSPTSSFPHSPANTRKASITLQPTPTLSGRIPAEGELLEEFRQLNSTLSTVTQEEWAHRHKALMRLEEIILGGVVHYSSFFRDFSSEIKVSDLRSMIVKEACIVVCMLCEALGLSFEPLAAFYVSSLLKQAVVKIKVISESADQCMKTLVKFTQLQNIRAIIEGTKDPRNVLVRQKSMSYIKVMLEEYDLERLEDLKDSISDAIKLNVGNTGGEVRAEARGCFIAFRNRWPEDGEQLLESMELSVRKYIDKEMPNSQLNRSGPLRLSGSSKEEISSSIFHQTIPPPIKPKASPSKIPGPSVSVYSKPRKPTEFSPSKDLNEKKTKAQDRQTKEELEVREAWVKNNQSPAKTSALLKVQNSAQVRDSVELFDLLKKNDLALHPEDQFFNSEYITEALQLTETDEELFSRLISHSGDT